MRALLATLLLFTACAARSTGVARPMRVHQAGNAAAIASCVSLGVIEERIESASEMSEPKEEVRLAVDQQAAKLRATDLVITLEESDATYALVRAEAYRCKR